MNKLTKNQERCKDCAYLVSDITGAWLCENCESKNDVENIENIKYCDAVETR